MGPANVDVAIDVNTSLATEDKCSAHLPLHMCCEHGVDGYRREDFHKRKRLGKIRDMNRELLVDHKRRAWEPHLETISEDTHLDLEPQIGFMDIVSYSGGFANLARLCKVDIPEWIINEIEDIVLVFLSLQGQTTLTGALATITSWVKRYFSKSLTNKIREYLVDLLTPTARQSMEGVLETPEWLKLLQKCKSNWRLVRNNAAFAQLSKLLGLLVTLGLCKVSDLEFRLQGFLLFTPEIQKRHSSAFDLLDATFETVLFFVEGMYLCFATKSLRPLLVSDHAALQLDEEYANVLTDWDLVKSGNLQKIKGLTDQHFEHRLNNLSTNLRDLANTLTGFDKKLVMDKFQKVLTLQNEFVTLKLASGVRHEPFSLLFFGESSQGKTIACEQVIDALCTSGGLPIDKKFRATYNAGDKFMSNWSTDKVVLKFDDMCNDKANFVERAPTRAILDVINNEMFYAPMANIDQKGKVFVEPWIVTGTTNKKDLDAGVYSNCPYSIQRRFITITVTAKDEFQRVVDGTTCGLDSNKVKSFNKALDNPLFDDVWRFTVERPVKPTKLHLVASYKPITWHDQVLQDIDIFTLIRFLCDEFCDHRENQAAILEGAKNRERNMQKCYGEGCNYIYGYCPYHPAHIDSDSESDDESVPPLEPCHEDASLCEEASPDTESQNCDGDASPDAESQPSDESIQDTETQIGGKIVKSLTRLLPHARNKIKFDLCERVEDKAAQVLYEKGRRFLRDFDWVQAVPTPVMGYMCQDTKENPFKGSWRQFVYQTLYADVIDEDYEYRSRAAGWLAVLYIATSYAFSYVYKTPWYGHGCLILTSIIYMLYMKNLVEEVERQLLETLLDKNVKVAPIVKKHRDDVVKYACGASVAVGALYVMGKVIRGKYAAYKTQGSLAPMTQQEVDARDAEKNVWTTVVSRPLPLSEVSKTVRPDVLQGVIEKNLVCCQFGHGDGKIGQLNCLFLKSNVVLVPSHYFDDYGEVLACSFFKKDPIHTGGKFAARLESRCSWKIPQSDLVMCYCPNGGSFRDLTKHFPLENVDGSLNIHLTYRFADGRTEKVKGAGTTALVTVQERYTYPAMNYKLGCNTFPGLCGAVVHTESVGSVICGIHLAGRSNTPHGVCGLLNQQVLKDGYAQLRSKEGVLLTGTAEKFETQVLGKTVVDPNAMPHGKSPLRFMPHGSQVEYYGSCPGATTSTTVVKVTPISEAIIDICGEPNIYGPPEFKPEWKGYQDCLANLAIPALPYEYEWLEQAIVDYKRELLAIFMSELWNGTRPLTDLENWSGIPGLKFVDAIKLTTAVGYPLSGEKSKYVYIARNIEELLMYYTLMGGEATPEELARIDHGYQVIKPITEISDEIERIEECYKKGQRGYTIAKACKKDEILAKKKCRIFYGNAIALTFLIRKYYLPLLRVLQMNPLVSECAVGINSHGPEWDEFYQHATKFGMDRLIGGDYGKYDQKLPSQLIIASLRILIDCAAVCKYTDEDLRVMEAMVGDIVYSIIAFNGDLIGLTEGTHISGNSLTVIINGICGSLNMRCYFFSNPENKGKKFRDNVALMTYGDDNIGSVSSEVNNFTIAGASKFFDTYGQVYTMPDKESELLDFLPPEDFEFLKRKSVYHPGMGKYVGALTDKSCFKMLHCFMRRRGSPDTEDVAAAKNIDTALSEWFNHGEEVYELRRQQMTEVAKRCGISMYCAGLDQTYEDRLDNWKSTYEK